MATHDYDVVVIGAGIGGLYATHRLRNEFGLSVHGYERARDVGGVWLWNCYPGARVDMEAKDYAYRFSPELRQEWQWSELFPAQPEILSYLGHVADRFDLRRDFTFNTSVTSLTWDAGSAIWIVNTSDGNTTRARFIIAAPGSMSAPKQPEFPGVNGSRFGDLGVAQPCAAYSQPAWLRTNTDPATGTASPMDRAGRLGRR